MQDISPQFERWKNKLNVPMLEFLIFRLLDQKEMYGRSIIQNAQEVISIDIKIPTIYAMLKRGVDEKMIELAYTEDEESVTRGTARKYYKLTDLGRSLYHEMRSHLENNELLQEVIR